jgi:hypothetical protein
LLALPTKALVKAGCLLNQFSRVSLKNQNAKLIIKFANGNIKYKRIILKYILNDSKIIYLV